MDLDERKRRILNEIVNYYIQSGEPIGSKTLIDRGFFNISSATVRNEMLELEQLGYLAKPHTSAGRVPSNEAFKFYVANSLSEYNLTETDKQDLEKASAKYVGLQKIISDLSDNIAAFTGCTIFAVSPTYNQGVYTFEVLPSGKKSLAIMAISSNGNVKSVFERFDKDVTAVDAVILTKILNNTLSGFSVENIGNVRLMIVEHEIKSQCPHLSGISEALTGLVEQIKSYELHISGSVNLLSFPEFASIQDARKFIEILNQHEQITEALLETSSLNEIVIKIGSENKIFDNPNACMVSMNCDAKIPVIMGIIGPTRMDYSRIITGCNYVLKLMKSIIDSEF